MSEKTIIEPISKTIRRCTPTPNPDFSPSGWIAMTTALGRERRLMERVRYEARGIRRLSFQETLHPAEPFGGRLAKNELEAFYCGLNGCIDEFMQTLNYDNEEGYGCWSLGIISSQSQFLTALNEQLDKPDAQEEFVFFGSGPFNRLLKFRQLRFIHLSGEDMGTVFGEDDFVIEE